MNINELRNRGIPADIIAEFKRMQEQIRTQAMTIEILLEEQEINHEREMAESRRSI